MKRTISLLLLCTIFAFDSFSQNTDMASAGRPKNFLDGFQVKLTGGVCVPFVRQQNEDKTAIVAPWWPAGLSYKSRPGGWSSTLATIHNPTIDLTLSYPISNHISFGLGYEMSGTLPFYADDRESLYGGQMTGYYNGEKVQTTRYSEYQVLYLQIAADFTRWTDHKPFKVLPYVRVGVNVDESIQLLDIWEDQTEEFSGGDPKCERSRVLDRNNAIYDNFVYTSFGLMFNVKVWNRLSLVLDVRETGFLTTLGNLDIGSNFIDPFVQGRFHAQFGLAWNL